jgi:hypothetical protein
MSQQKRIHSLRQAAGASRQPAHADALDSLQQVLESFGLEHPYALEREPLEGLMSSEFFARGGERLAAASSGARFLYRLCALRKVVGYADWVTASDKERTVDDLWLTLKLDSDASGGWIPLSRYARGLLTGPRGFTWWTLLNLFGTNLICGAHAIGLPNDWLTKYSVILRYPLERAAAGDSIFIPTVLDAFDGEIFYPTESETKPSAGSAISIEHSAALESGADEFVLVDVDVEAVEFIPVFIDLRMKESHPVNLDPDPGLRTLLETYYESLGG